MPWLPCPLQQLCLVTLTGLPVGRARRILHFQLLVCLKASNALCTILVCALYIIIKAVCLCRHPTCNTCRTVTKRWQLHMNVNVNGNQVAAYAAHPGGTYAQQAAALATPLDIVVATPQKLLQHAEQGNVYYGDVQYVVLDEADTMFDRGFGPEVEKILGPLRSKSTPVQFILVAATLTKVSSHSGVITNSGDQCGYLYISCSVPSGLRHLFAGVSQQLCSRSTSSWPSLGCM